jgi:hypothetical protein
VKLPQAQTVTKTSRRVRFICPVSLNNEF